MQQYVIYTRVSSKKQGKSGLGLEAQSRDISIFLQNYAQESYEILGEFQDVQSGADDNRPELMAAIKLAKENAAELLVAKLDRLSRKVSFIARLIEDKKLRLRVASMPQADNFQLHIYAALAEQEREFISKRTKAALLIAKAKGVKLGGQRDATMKRNKVLKNQADDRAIKLGKVIKPMRDTGKTLQEIADAMEVMQIPTARQGKWSPVQVKRILDRMA